MRPPFLRSARRSRLLARPTCGMAAGMDWIGNFGGWQWAPVAVAFALGLLVGLQRGWAQRGAPPGSRFAGIRTFGLLGLAGGLCGSWFASMPAVSLVFLSAAALLVLISYLRATQRSPDLSGTGSLVGLLTLACGFMAGQGQTLPATAVTVAMVLLLAMRTPLHRVVAWLSEDDVRAIARFALIALVILPLLPDRAFGPYDAWNPRQLWLVVVMVSGFSLAGYLAARALGPARGTLATAAAGALVSSTAVTASLAAHLRAAEPLPGQTTTVTHAGICMASAVMFLRVNALALLIAPLASPQLAALSLPGFVVSLAALGWFLLRMRREGAASGEPPASIGDTLKNPFAIAPALLMMALVMAMSVLAHWVLARAGDAGVATVLAISGSIDVDSAVITLGSLPAGTVSPRVAGMILIVPIVLNTLFKAGLAISVAGWSKARASAVPLALSALASGAALAAALLAA
jgi:uncharacterized membrane protein (DUF4010 family)